MGSFKVLMWKHYTVRKRRLFQTLVEFIAPVGMMLVLYILKDSMQKKSGALRTLPLQKFSMDSAQVFPRILISPDSEATRILMSKALSKTAGIVSRSISNRSYSDEQAYDVSIKFEKFSKNSTDYFPWIVITPDSEGTRSLLGQVNDRVRLTREKALSKIASNIPSEISDTSDIKHWQEYEVLIKFDNMTGPAIPDTLSYTIGVRSPFEPGVPVLRIYEEIESFKEPLLRLQWAIDSSFLKLKSPDGQKIQNVSFEQLSESPTMRAKNYYYINTVFYLFPYVSFLAPLLPFIFLMIRLLEERSTGIQELVKMVGVTPATLGITQFLNSMPPCLLFAMVSTLLMKADGLKAMVPATNGFLIFTGMFLHYVSMISMAYASSFIAKEAQYTVSLSMFVYIGLWVPVRLVGQESKQKWKLFFKGLLPHCPTYWYLNEMHNTEIYYGGIGITFNNWNEHYGLHKSGGDNGTVMASYLMQILQIIIFFSISWYLEKVRPGKYGIALPWNFPFKKEYWRKTHNIPEQTGETLTSHDPEYQKYFEEPPQNMEAGIKISHVSKIFGSGAKKFQALNNVTLDIYKGEITVLLGHNGAGKTTLISIITGMINPTSGKIYVKGMDTVTQQVEVRKHLGLCPQHNLFFPDLTVKEHFLFFSMIKGGSFAEAKKSSQALMEQLDLTDKANRKTSELSGGMLRRMQLGCALCGNASVLILDEPTSGLDVEARRELWDMLLALRGDRTLVLTTHYMEEADVLGDRLAALHAGRMRCHATPMFLKRAVGSGYRLSVMTIGDPDEPKITECVQGSVPSAKVKPNSPNTPLNTVLYDLPAEANLPTLFQNLEKRKTELNISFLSVGITTLEEVFLELCCDVDQDIKIKDDDMTRIPGQDHYVGLKRICRQTGALFRRQLDYTRAKLIAFVILQVIMPLVMCIVLTELFNNADTNPYAALRLSMYTEGVPKKALYRLKNNSTRRSNTMDEMRISYPDFEFKNYDDLHGQSSCTCRRCKEGIDSQFVIGIDVNDTEAKIFYKPSVSHSASVGLNFLSNVLAVQRMANANGHTITTKLSKVRQMQDKPKIHIPKTKMNCALFAIFNIFIVMSTAINDITLPCRERLTVARHTHIMAGCPPYLYWLITFIYHMIGYILFCCTATLLAAFIMENDKTVDDVNTLMAYAAALVLCGMDFYAFAYFISYYFNERGASMLLIGMTIIFGFLSPILMMALEDLRASGEPEPIFNRIMNIVGIVLPAHMFTDVVSKMTDTARFNSYCRHNYEMCSMLPYISEGFDNDKCCKDGSATKGPYNYFAFSKFAMGWPLIIIMIQFFVFATLVLLLEYGVFNRCWNSVGTMRAVQYPEKRFSSPQVTEEKEYVTKTIALPKEQIAERVLVNEAWKTYYRLCGKPTFALRDANFSVGKGECFGLLGVNGAGKTTTFKLMSYQEAATKGNIYVSGNYLTANRTQVLVVFEAQGILAWESRLNTLMVVGRTDTDAGGVHDEVLLNSNETSPYEKLVYMRCLGYCPQFCGLDDFRSGANNLRMLLVMRGFRDRDVKSETSAWLQVTGMEKYGHRAVVDYSGGMVRRLATAASLCSGTPLTLLDEPTAGVDAAARRLVWSALKRGMLNDRSIVLTSHNMDEMEMLCKRVTILSQGEMCVLGTPAGLREEHAPGNSVVLKLRASVVQSPVGPERVQALKDSLEQKFDCSLKDSHMTSLHYRINEKMEYSEIFSRMGSVETEFTDLLEDYSVSDTTLEDVFLTFANN